jgi:mRNA-degrading endonuclease toxin of MazEF toxin-antitoxin module
MDVHHRGADIDIRFTGEAWATVVELPGVSAGLPKTSFALCHQVTTLDRAKLTGKAGTLPSEFLRSVEEAVKAGWISIDSRLVD